MGAAHIVKAYRLYAGRVPATSMQLLVYMALIAVDKDEEPWFGMGHDALAQLALGREPGRAGVKAVERAIGPLFDEGAITTQRHAAVRSDGPSTVRYRLHLDAPAEPRQKRRTKQGDFPRKPGEVPPCSDPSEDQRLPPETGHDVPHFPGSRPPETVPTSPENRGTEEVRGATRSEMEEEVVALTTDVTVSRAREAASRSKIPPSDDPPRTTPIRRGQCPSHPGMRAGTRPDGQPDCVFCRRAIRLPEPTSAH